MEPVSLLFLAEIWFAASSLNKPRYLSHSILPTVACRTAVPLVVQQHRQFVFAPAGVRLFVRAQPQPIHRTGELSHMPGAMPWVLRTPQMTPGGAPLPAVECLPCATEVSACEPSVFTVRHDCSQSPQDAMSPSSKVCSAFPYVRTQGSARMNPWIGNSNHACLTRCPSVGIRSTRIAEQSLAPAGSFLL